MAPAEHQTGALLLRVWTETDDVDDVRIRVLAVTSESPPTPLADVVGVDVLCDVIRAWIEGIAGRRGSPH